MSTSAYLGCPKCKSYLPIGICRGLYGREEDLEILHEFLKSHFADNGCKLEYYWEGTLEERHYCSCKGVCIPYGEPQTVECEDGTLMVCQHTHNYHYDPTGCPTMWTRFRLEPDESVATSDPDVDGPASI